MASAINAIVGLSSSVTLFLPPALTPKRKSLSLSFVTRRRFPTVGSRLFWRDTGNRMLEIAHFSSNSNQKSEESGGTELSDEGSFPSGKVTCTKQSRENPNLTKWWFFDIAMDLVTSATRFLVKGHR